MKFKHLVISRLAIKWSYHRLNLSWDEWLNDSINLYDNYTRPSLLNQTNQNFILVTLVDESVEYVGNKLVNEVIVKVSEGNEQIGFKDELNEFIKNTFNDCDYLIMSRMDRDDMYHKDYINIIQDYVSNNPNKEYYIDNSIIYSFDSINNTMYLSNKYSKIISPFVTIVQKNNDGFVNKNVYSVQHSEWNKHLSGEKLDNLLPVQVIHNNNLLNKITGNKIKYNLSDFNKKTT